MKDTMQHTTDTMNAHPADMPNKREAIAGAFDHAADRLHDKADDMTGGRLAGITDKTANALDATGRYVRDMGKRDLMQDLTKIAKEHPGKSLVAAMAVGLLVGRSMTRSQS
jgi:ElaB/YqjD/DUF883 family membrane-anchored ribosome-binding protein